MKYIIFDMDDTLLTSDKKIDELTLKTLNKLKSLGHKIVINTARSKNYDHQYFEILKPHFSINNGGAVILDNNEKVIFQREIPNIIVKEIIKDLINISKEFSIQTLDTLYTFNKNYTNQDAVYFDFLNDNFNYDASKIVASIEDESLALKLKDKYNLEYVSYFKGPFRRFNHIEASKANGNKNLLKLFNHSLEDTIVFGDDIGDLEMINESKVGVLMKNSKEYLHDKVKIISKYTNDESGVAKFLIEYFNL